MSLHLRTLSVSAGYLEDAPVQFAKGLTCIIGARGTCKSTIVEMIRFVFDCDPNRIALMLRDPAPVDAPQDGPSCRGLIRAALEGGTARVEIAESRSGERSELSIERSNDGAPRVFRDGVKEIADARAVLKCVEIYSQGDLQRIAEDGLKRLDLIDQPNRQRVDQLKTDRANWASRLRDLGPQIRQLRNDIDIRRNELKQLEAYRSELSQLQTERPKLSEEMSAERQAFQHRQSILETARQSMKRRDEILEYLQPFWDEAEGFAESAAKIATANAPQAQQVADLLRRFGMTLASTREAVASQATVDIRDVLAALAEQFETHSQKYYQLMRDQQQVTDSLKREDGLKRQIQHLAAAEKQLDALAARYKALLDERQQLRQRVDGINDTLYQLRLDQVEQINAAYGDVVVLTLHQGTRSEAYRTLVAQLLQGSRLRNQEEVAVDLADKVRPSDLVDIVEAGDSKRLADALGRDMGQMARLVAFLIDNASLYGIEAAVFDDWLEITMYVDGVAKPLGQLSKGQMATALLPLILRPADYPLIFDQPEDDLDNGFIYETLVTKIRELKHTRQLVFVTHNANIPVLGEAEHIVVMSMQSPRRAACPLQGDVDVAKKPILKILEGGAEAFKLRQEKYGSLVAGSPGRTNGSASA